MKETISKGDVCECVYCGCRFDGRKACNYDMDPGTVTCPKCHKDMKVLVICEFVCRELEKV